MYFIRQFGQLWSKCNNFLLIMYHYFAALRLRSYFRSIVFWILILYIFIGTLSLVSKKYRIDKFYNYCETFLMKVSLQQQIKLLPFYMRSVKNVSESKLGMIADEINQSASDFVFLFYDYKLDKLISHDTLSFKEFNLSHVLFLQSSENSFEAPLQEAKELGLQQYFPNSYFVSKKITIQNEDLLVLIGTKKSIFKCFHEDLLKNSLQIDFLIILILFILYFFVTIFAIAPVFLFIRKFNLNRLNSGIFKSPNTFEFNHIRRLRITLLKSLRKIETFEAERVQMLNTLIKHQNDIEMGKMVSQIIHDLKSPLSVFEELLHERSFIKNEASLIKSNLALMKMYSLIENIRDPKKEKFLSKQKNIFDFSKFFSEISCYAKKKNSKIMIKPSFLTPEIYCDHDKLERCLLNLIRNAIHFCSSYCVVDWKIQSNESLYIEVIDDGKGVSPDIQDMIFEWRMTGNKIEGTGVGLSYVKFVADIHKGSVSYFRRNNLTVFALLIPNIFDKYVDDSILLEKSNCDSKTMIEKSIRNKIIVLIEDHLNYEKVKSICWPNDIEVVYHRSPQDAFDLAHCFCIYTDTSADVIEKALSIGINVVLHKRSYSKQVILKKILQTKKNNGV